MKTTKNGRLPVSVPGTRATLTAVLLLGSGLLLACGDDGAFLGPETPGQATGDAIAMGMWSPSGHDSCSASVHDAYAVVGADGLLYPTWHPPVDAATGCTFGHEHGRDPRGSDLYDQVGDIPFGHANQQLDLTDFGASRHEDHVGHKIEWENDVEMRIGDGGGPILSVRCDVLMKMHQGSHSPDAFTNNMHELFYAASCTDGTRFAVTLLTPIGDAGELVVACDRDRRVDAGTPNPPNSLDGGGKRAIPDVSCLEEHMVVPEGGRSNFHKALRESWEISGRIRTVDNRRLLSFNPYFQVLFPSRVFNASAPGRMARPIDYCYDGDRPGFRGRGDLCDQVQTGGEPVAWDDPRSPFDGARRFVDVNDISIRNDGGPEVWYTDPFGRNARREPFLGSVRQIIASHDNAGLPIHGPNIGRDRDYGGQGVHAPN